MGDPSSSTLSNEEELELQRLEKAAPSKKRVSKQMSMWERRRRRQERRKKGIINEEGENLTDEDLHELKGCIELGFGFNEENGQRLCSTLPALDLYFAVNRQLVSSPVSSPESTTPPRARVRGRSASMGCELESWRICSQGDDPEQVKTKLRHWAVAVACSVKQSS